MRHSKTKGFSIIELLISISIMGILAGIVLGAFQTVRAKAVDAAIGIDLENVRSQAALYAESNNGSYVGVCSIREHAIGSMLQQISVVAGYGGAVAGLGIASSADEHVAACHGGDGRQGSGWAVSVPLRSHSGMYACIDSAGGAMVQTTYPIGEYDIACR